MGLNPFERTIMSVLTRAGRPLTTRQIAEYGEMSWLTAKKYLTKLNKEKRISKERRGKSVYWSLTREGHVYSTLRGLNI